MPRRWIEEENPVRAIDAFVDALDLASLGFEDVEPAATGRPAFHHLGSLEALHFAAISIACNRAGGWSAKPGLLATASKARMGATHFLLKTLPKVAAEMALHVLACSLTRVMNIIGIKR